ncbi:hypothetical protein BV22DRAFT_1026062, partial [Leucogyrophana mollusca]
MKYGIDATACPPDEEEAPVLVLTRPDLDDPEAIWIFLQKIRYALAKGRAVIISDWNVDVGPRLKWCAKSLELEFYSLRRVVIWQDAALRAQDRAEINKTCSTAREGTALTDSYWSSHSPDSAALAPKAGSEKSKRPEIENAGYEQGSKIHHRGELSEFLSTLDDPESCGNLLDIGSQDFSRPWVV